MPEMDEEVRLVWIALTQSIRSTRFMLLKLGGALHAIQSLGVRSSDFRALSVDELWRRRENQEPLPDVPRTLLEDLDSLKMWSDILRKSQRGLGRCSTELNSAVTAMPEELVTLLSGVRCAPWRAHFRRYYADRLLDLPNLVLKFRMAHLCEEAIPPGYDESSTLASLPYLLAHSEVCTPFPHWSRLLRRADSYVADLHAIADDVGAAIPDGPVPPNRWRRDGIVTAQGMTPLSWKLVTFLWERYRRAGTIEECADAVFGEDSRTVDKTRTGSHRKKVNEFFRSNGIGWKVKTEGDYVVMEPVAPLASPPTD
ncbi:hypothetical protein PLANPX_3403 [Lacipirellula parvula]|uniref:Uncharacterized protein n=1 Tax=Lacipirellula parvula TaxID=2650471 RepID=A0A5K7XFY6_9BACT|nr:hypothetical protein PLANPX_3403 [Lacipirellula parvula]